MRVLHQGIQRYLDACKKTKVPADKVIKSLSEQGWGREVIERATEYYLPPTPIFIYLNQNGNNDKEGDPFHSPLITPGVNDK